MVWVWGLKFNLESSFEEQPKTIKIVEESRKKYCPSFKQRLSMLL